MTATGNGLSWREHLKRLIWPSGLMILTIAAAYFHEDLASAFGNADTLSRITTAMGYFTGAWLISRILALLLDRAASRRGPYPQLLKSLIAGFMFLAAGMISVSTLLGQGAIGALAGSGLILAMLGFAIRNVVADTLSGVALGLDGPFRIGDWVDIDGLARGRVVEIDWRTTRILTTSSTHVILPNSEIARQRITNYSAPQPKFRTQLTITLDHRIPVARAKAVLLEAMKRARLILDHPKPDVIVHAHEKEGITYALRYWLSRFDRDVVSRDEIYSLVDEALRNAGLISRPNRVELFLPANTAAEGLQLHADIKREDPAPKPKPKA